MQLNVTGANVEVTPALRGYVEKKLERIARHFDQVIDVHCVLTVEKLRQKAEATLHVSGNAIHADATEENMYAAIDLLVDKQAPVGFRDIRLSFELDTDADDEQLATLLKLTERYCVVYQTLNQSPELNLTLARAVARRALVAFEIFAVGGMLVAIGLETRGDRR